MHWATIVAAMDWATIVAVDFGPSVIDWPSVQTTNLGLGAHLRLYTIKCLVSLGQQSLRRTSQCIGQQQLVAAMDWATIVAVDFGPSVIDWCSSETLHTLTRLLIKRNPAFVGHFFVCLFFLT
jgi:hypothetical protein